MTYRLTLAEVKDIVGEYGAMRAVEEQYLSSEILPVDTPMHIVAAVQNLEDMSSYEDDIRQYFERA